MKLAKWSNDQRDLYWKQQANEQDALEEQKRLQEEEFNKGKIEGMIEGEVKGKIKGEIKGEISKVKSLIKFKIPKELITEQLKFLTKDQVKDELESNIKYIEDHSEDSDSAICDHLELVGRLADFDAMPE